MGSAWVGLMRHAKAWYPGMAVEERSETHPDLTVVGATSARAVAERCGELLDEVGCDANQVVVYDVDTPQSIATAEIVREVLAADDRPDRPPPLRGLRPEALPTHTASLEDIKKAWADTAGATQDEGTHRYVIVGHDPQMSWLLHHLGDRETRWHTLATGELMLLEPRPDSTHHAPRYRRPRFVFSPTDPATTTELQAKIKSKMDIAKVLGTFFTALVTFAATQLLDREDASTRSMWLAVAGLGLLATATVLYFVTLFFYDELLMPQRFWPSTLPKSRTAKTPRSRHVLRPPGPDLWVLYENMLRVWTWAFIPATLLAGAGITALTLALADPSGWWWLAAAASILTVASISIVFRHQARPRLGVDD
jgi:phosphohistidine phosphatase SixA